MKINFLAMTAAAVMTCMGCSSNQDPEKATGIYLKNLDQTVAPGEDFDLFTNGGWKEANPLTDEYSRYGVFDQLMETNRKQLKELIEEIANQEQTKGSNGQKIADIYNIALDSVKLNSDGIAPIKAELDAIAAITDKSKIIPTIPTLSTHPYFQFYVGADIRESDMNIFNLYQGGIGLNEKEYYIDTDEETTRIRDSYKQHIIKMFELAGFDTEVATKNMEAVLRIETRIAKASFSMVEQRDVEANYHKMSVAELKKSTPNIDWDGYLKALGVDIKDLNVSQVEPIVEVSKIIKEEPLADHIAYMQWELLNRSSSYLSDDLVEQDFSFYGGVMSGKKVNQPRWKRAINVVNRTLGEVVGQLYVEKYFPAAAKERMLNLVKNLQTSLGERIDAAEWMGSETKAKAHEKLATFYVKVGYPDKWKDYSKLEITKDSYWANIKRTDDFNRNKEIEKIGKKVDRDEWGMTPQTVNAYYNPTTNEICFPAAILQYPFFDMEADDAFNYGGIGVVIGHEMTHGFDDQGRQFDKVGNFNNWWSKEDADNFTERANVLVDYFNKIEVLPGLFANGSLTLGENIADNGGMQISYQAYKSATKDAPLGEVNGFTADQRFFLSYAGLWAANIRDEQVRVYTKSDPHSLSRWRINGAVPHIDAWYEAFDIKEGDKMYIAPEDRARIW